MTLNTNIELDPIPLNIEPSRFLDAYNMDISDYIERHTFKETAQKTNKEIMYLSYSHAYRLFRTHFPEFDVATQENPETKGFIFREIDGRGYFIKPYVYRKNSMPDRLERTPYYYYPLLTVSGLAVYPNDLVSKKDYKTNEYKPVEGQYVADIQLINKSIQRGIVKAIALTTGIGLKLWTGDDLDSSLLDKKFKLLEHLNELATEYRILSGNIHFQVNCTYVDSITAITNEGKSIRTMINKIKSEFESVIEVPNAEIVSVDNQTV